MKPPKVPKASKATSVGAELAAFPVVPDLSDSDFHLPSLPDDWIISRPSRPAPRTAFNPGSFVLRSGTYDILLVVDAMEVTGGSYGGKKNRKLQTLEELEASQVGLKFSFLLFYFCCVPSEDDSLFRCVDKMSLKK